MKQSSVLQIIDLSVQIGGLKVVSNVSMELKPGELVGLIGPNGAGKTTIFNALTGFSHPYLGQVIFKETNLTNQPAHVIARHRLARTFQNIRLFRDLTVLDNLKIAYHQHFQYSFLSGILRTKKFRLQEKQCTELAWEILHLVGLDPQAQKKAGALPYGEQRKLEIARALMIRPELLLLDEPAAGMNPQETRELTGLIRKIKKVFQLTVFLIEHDMNLVMNLCERLYVLDYGVLICQGPVEKVRRDRRVITAYLGEDALCPS